MQSKSIHSMKKNEIKRDLRYLQLLSQSFPTIADASTEIINLQASRTCQRVLSTSSPTCMENTRPSSMC